MTGKILEIRLRKDKDSAKFREIHNKIRREIQITKEKKSSNAKKFTIITISKKDKRTYK